MAAIEGLCDLLGELTDELGEMNINIEATFERYKKEPSAELHNRFEELLCQSDIIQERGDAVAQEMSTRLANLKAISLDDDSDD